jgi:alpha-N-arabinofuranosidase
MKPNILFFVVALLVPWSASRAAELHVATTGNDANPGTKKAPLHTIQRAADLAQPGDVVTVHAGVYRERVNPPRGGQSDSRRIVYQAARGERVEIKGSEVVKHWARVTNEVWQVTLPNSFFGDFNPYRDLIHGDWFDPRGREHHTGAVYLNGDWLTEAAKLDELFTRIPPAWLAQTGNSPLNPQLWFARVDATNTTIWAQFNGVNPNDQLVETNVRRTVFYPDQPGRDYITVRGFTLRDAATPWAPPTAEQVGLIGTHWSKGWIIENNVVSHSVCSGIALGKYGDTYDNTSANTAEGYVKTLERALQNGWNRATIGHHIVRNNTISHCEQAGIVGSLGAAFCTVTGNTIHDIHVRRLFSGAEMAGIKFHGAIDTTIRGNHIYRTCLGLWLDWMAQGTRVSGNLFHDNAGQDVFFEVDHGPFLVDNNLLLSPTSLLDMSEGGAYVHNLFAGRITNRPEPDRVTPYHPAHATTVAGLVQIRGGGDRFYNNLFIGNGDPAANPAPTVTKELQWISRYGLCGYDTREVPLLTGGNVFLHGARPYTVETQPFVRTESDPGLNLEEQNGRFILHFRPGPDLLRAVTKLVTTERLGKARVAGVSYENADGSPLQVDTDFFGKARSRARPTAGPFEQPGAGPLALRVW